MQSATHESPVTDDNSVTTGDQAPTISETPSIRVLMVGTCPSLSNKSRIGYLVGCTEDGAIQLKLVSNTGGGFFSKAWTPMSAIQQASSLIPAESTVTTSMLMSQIFQGGSVNSSSFVMAILKQVGLVLPVEGKELSSRHRFLRTDGAVFFAECKALIDSNLSLAVDAPKPAVRVKKSEGAPVLPAKPAKSKSAQRKGGTVAA